MSTLIGGLANLAQISSEEIAAITVEGVIDENAFLAIFNARENGRIDGIVDQIKKGNGDLLKRAKSESLTEAETALSKQFNTERKPLQEMVLAIVEKARTEDRELIGTKADTLTKDSLVKLPLFQELTKELLEAKDSELATVKTEFSDYKASETTKTHASKVNENLLSEYLKMNPVLPSDASKRDRAIQLQMGSFNPNHFGFDDLGMYLKDADGNPILDKSKGYQRQSVKDILREKSIFEFNEVTPQNVAGQNGQNNGSNGHVNIKIDFSRVASVEEAFQRMRDASTKDEKELWLKFIEEKGHTLS